MSNSTMTAEEFRQHMDHLIMAARSFVAMTSLVSDVELAELARQIELAKSVGCFVDPTAWIKANDSGSLDRQAAVIQAIQDFRATVMKHFTLRESMA